MRLCVIAMSLLSLISRGAETAKDSCFECHIVMEGMSVIFMDDVHYRNTVSCADCHGGDAKEDDQNLSMSAERGFKVRVKRQGIPDYCGGCHSDASIMHQHKPE